MKEVTPGELLAGKFRVERILGRGGMGVVIEATNVQLDQRVALKLLAAGDDNPTAAERFTREARAAARLRSEHVARVHDVGKDPVHGPFIVMELLEGKTLAEVLRTTGRVPLHRAVEYVIDACEGLAEAHARGIVHQDVKPANLFLATGADGRPSIKLLDFGIATIRSKDSVADPKSSGASVGTPAYLAPEQLRGSADVDHRADVWALGCVLYELLTGDRPFRATRFTELVTKILEALPHPLPDDVDVPDAVAGAIVRCLEKDPAKRWNSTGELALALLPFARRRAHSAAARAVAHLKSSGLDPGLEMPSSMPPPPSESDLDIPSGLNLRAPAVPSFSTAPTEPPPRENEPRRRRWVFSVALLALAVVAGGAILFARRESQPSMTGAPVSIQPAVASKDVPPSIASTAPAVGLVEGSASAAATPEARTAPRATTSTSPRRRLRSATSAAASASASESEIRLSR